MTHAKGTAGAHDKYIEREGACRIAFGEHIPVEIMPVHAWLDTQEEADRKNARIIDKFTLALPVELNEDQRIELVRAFVQELTGGVVPWRAAIHDKRGNDVNNPHCHLIIRDRHIETGKRAVGFSEKGSTERVREAWEQVCNEALAAVGRSERVSRLSLTDQGITDRKPQGHEGPQARSIAAKAGKSSTKLSRLSEARSRPSAAQRVREAEQRIERREANSVSLSLNGDDDELRWKLASLKRSAIKHWAELRAFEPARKALHRSARVMEQSRFIPGVLVDHMKDLATVFFRNTREAKKPMPLRDASPVSQAFAKISPAQSTPEVASSPKKLPAKFRLSF